MTANKVDAREASAAYDKIDRYLRNNLDDDDYAEYSAALARVRFARVEVKEIT